ncbi:calcium-binding protein PBP1-like [Rhodamnia argentea]|uniref:Calcium-binding protein PBP1-like n=1 Tax=Rhodamnia argentea TaxID=178133 RepID=A0A8B8QDW4_9MYRT|nr:calcium-binding protein PBP1-like [Rhodamnia argentea]
MAISPSFYIILSSSLHASPDINSFYTHCIRFIDIEEKHEHPRSRHSSYREERKKLPTFARKSVMDGGVPKRVEFEDMLPTMAEKLGGDGLIRELCNGFELLMDRERGVITLESLRRNSAVLGLQDLREDELASMLREGDVDGDGVLSQMEFCVLMFRLSPELMEQSRAWFEKIVEEEFRRERKRSS